MPRLALILGTIALALGMSAGVALADPVGPGGPPGGPCAGGAPPWFCDGGKVRDGITITVEPAGANCPAGGIRLEVRARTKHEPKQIPEGAVPASEDPGRVTTGPNGPPPPPPPPEAEVFFVCNGTDGPAGPAGPIGPGGPAGPAGPAGTITVPVAPKVCQSSTRIGVRLYLPPRLARFGVVRLRIAKVDGPLRFDGNVRTRVNRTGAPGPPFVFVPIRNRNCGAYLVTVGRGTVEPIVQVWNITGRFGLKRTTITG